MQHLGDLDFRQRVTNHSLFYCLLVEDSSTLECQLSTELSHHKEVFQEPMMEDPCKRNPFRNKSSPTVTFDPDRNALQTTDLNGKHTQSHVYIIHSHYILYSILYRPSMMT